MAGECFQISAGVIGFIAKERANKSWIQTFTANSDGYCAGKELKMQARKRPRPQRMDIPEGKKGLFRARRDSFKANRVPLPSPALFYSLVLLVESGASEKTSGLEAGKWWLRFCR